MASIHRRPNGKRAVYVLYRDETGKQRSQSFGSSPSAEDAARRFIDRLSAGDDSDPRKSWDAFVERFRRVHASARSSAHETELMASLRRFQSLTGISDIGELSTGMVDDFIAERRLDRGHRAEFVSPATVNKDLRNLRTAFGKAKRWKLISDDIEIDMLPVTMHEPRFMTIVQYDELIRHLAIAERPELRLIQPAAWWEAFLSFQIMTGWRRSQVLSLQWGDIDLMNAQVHVPASRTKGRRYARVALLPNLIRLLLRLKIDPESEDPRAPVFEWPHALRTLYHDLQAIQDAANVRPPYDREYDYQPYFGFHDFRRSFATWNAGQLDLFELQHLMQHQSLETTQLYAAMSQERRAIAADKLVLPTNVADA